MNVFLCVPCFYSSLGGSFHFFPIFSFAFFSGPKASSNNMILFALVARLARSTVALPVNVDGNRRHLTYSYVVLPSKDVTCLRMWSWGSNLSSYKAVIMLRWAGLGFAELSGTWPLNGLHRPSRPGRIET
ncbi:hypothetical protein CRG98_010052 [Punica granatum]|uniref:Uncharacterized protein n=1 Tax=Punica granatum TaxID=22663 RepID=A0A2I0KM90_PUNGR|nr:hypothetical protein CRG98_010052 [Punica granatum]